MRRPLIVIDRIVAFVCRMALGVSAVALLVSLALVAYSVAMRYVLGRPVPWVDEAVGYLLVALVMCGAADALRRGEHISLDLLTERLPPALKRASAVLALAAVLLVGVVMVVAGLETAAFTKMLGIRSTGYLAMPMHLPQLLIPLGGALLAIAALGGLLRMVTGQPAVPEDEDSDDLPGGRGH